MSLQTPEAIGRLQKKLYLKAKTEPAFRFYLLYDKVHRPDILLHAYRLAKANGGAAGVDGVTFAQIEAAGRETWLQALEQELRERTYKPSAVRRVMIPKPGGGERPLGIPTIRDRVAQTAAKLVMEPIFEADFESCAYGYRPDRSAVDAVQEVKRALDQGYMDVVDADLSKYFDTIPHAQLLRSVARRVADAQMLRLIKSWLKTPVAERDENGNQRMSGGKDATKGTPQGGVISPLLANIYMHRYLKAWRQQGKGAEFQARIVNYADDFVILSRRQAAQALEWTRAVMRAIGLTLNEQKTCIRDGRRESFNFLGYTFGHAWHKRLGYRYLTMQPAAKAVDRLKEKIRGLLHPGNTNTAAKVVARLNRLLRGWANYFSVGTRLMAYRAIDRCVYDQLRGFLRRRHKVSTQGHRRFGDVYLYGDLGVVRMRTLHVGSRRMP